MYTELPIWTISISKKFSINLALKKESVMILFHIKFKNITVMKSTLVVFPKSAAIIT